MKLRAALFILALFASPILAFDQININFIHPPNAPYFIGNPEMNIDAEEFMTVSLKIKSEKSGTARLFWATNFDPQMNEPKSIWFFLKKSDYPREYVFNLRSQNPYWAGFVQQFAVFSEPGIDGIEITSANAKTSNFSTSIISGWQEFWGPRGRVVVGSTINTIQSSNLFGRPIFVYIYWLLGLAAIGISAWGFNRWLALKKKPPFAEVWLKSGKNIALVLAVGWALLELSSLYNNLLAVRDDWKYVGKSYQEKLTIANTGDFYPFIRFCEKHIPSGAKFEMRIPPIYNDIKAIYYLYPHQYSTTEADYLVVYDRMVEPAVAAPYLPWQTFRPGAYIMKKRGER